MDEIKQTQEDKMSVKNKIVLLVIFAMLLGFVIKTEAAKRVTVGFEDYKLLSAERTYDINGLQKGLELQKTLQAEQAKEAEKKATEAAQGAGTDKATCDVGAGETCE